MPSILLMYIHQEKKLPITLETNKLLLLLAHGHFGLLILLLYHIFTNPFGFQSHTHDHFLGCFKYLFWQINLQVIKPLPKCHLLQIRLLPGIIQRLLATRTATLFCLIKNHSDPTINFIVILIISIDIVLHFASVSYTKLTERLFAILLPQVQPVDASIILSINHNTIRLLLW
ncbi:hypothetical protein PanWU01x14_203790 [Parasponia andersonii]|uniref:Uncharacterized protein n=1 Tax=Parasponia andersonii TaxID=3476 RepID=A0A2P5BWU3_PARAD|nr:hypothetical protein PanWU01x14_203790 [Parasponia andersonii]